MTNEEFIQALDSLIEKYALNNEEYEDIHSSYNLFFKGKYPKYSVKIDVTKEK